MIDAVGGPVTVARFSHLFGRVVPAIALTLGGAFVAPVPAAAQSSVAAAFTDGYRWDAMRRLVGKISPAASGTTGPFIAERYTYDADGQLIRTEKGYLASWFSETTAPAGWTGFTIVQQIDVQFDAVGNKISEMGSAGGTAYILTQNSYDADNRLQCTAVRMSTTVFGTPSSVSGTAFAPLSTGACTQSVSGSPNDRITQNIYDAAGQTIQVLRGVGTGLLQAYATYAYTADGKQSDVIDANGNHTQYDYDGFDRQTSWTFPSKTPATSFDGSTQATALATANAPNTADVERYTYDANGNRLTLTKRDGTVLTYTYDGLNRVTAKTVSQRAGLPATDTRSVNYSYDLMGRQLTATFADLNNGVTEGVTNTYDALGRLSSTKLTMDGAARTVSYCFDADGNRTVASYPDSTVGSCPTGGGAPTGWTNYVRYAYDGLDRATGITTSAGTTPASYTYNADGTRAAYKSNGAAVSTSYSYDAIDRLGGLTNAPANTGYGDTFGFSYNPASQIMQLTKSNNAFVFTGIQNVARPYVANGLNQYASVAGSSLTYDANGNLTSDGLSTGPNVYNYDVENRMVGVTGAHTASMRYDPLGRLYEVVNTATGATTRFVYGRDELLAEYDGSGNLLRRYVHGADLKSDDPIAWYEGAGFTSAAERLLRPNWQGSIELVTDTSGASVYGANTYDEYGIGGTGNVGRFQYTGQAWVAEIGMYYYKARMYSPTLGRFMQTDPIGYKDDVDLYAYVANDPVDGTDPTGEKGCSPAGPNEIVVCGNTDNPKPPVETKPKTGGGGSVHFKAGVPQPSQRVGDMLICIARCTGHDLRVTATSNDHKSTDPHSRGLAADVTTNEPDKVMQCSANCGARYQQNEYRHPSPNATGGHVHLQMVPGRGGATGPYFPSVPTANTPTPAPSQSIPDAGSN